MNKRTNINIRPSIQILIYIIIIFLFVGELIIGKASGTQSGQEESQGQGKREFKQLHSFKNSNSTFIPHDPIVITSNEDFVTQGWPGSGTTEDPYLIENLLLNGSSEVGSAIKISSVQIPFVIRNCKFTKPGFGIELKTVQNARIENNTFIETVDGINLFDCSFNTIVNNICLKSTSNGINLSGSSVNNSIINNVSNESSLAGIFLRMGSENVLSNNSCHNNHVYGIFLGRNANNSLFFNNCTQNGEVGILLSLSDRNLVFYNTATHNYAGLRIEEGLGNDIRHNNFSYNTFGIYLDKSWNNIVTENVLSYNWKGIVENNRENTIKNNTFITNTTDIDQPSSIGLNWLEILLGIISISLIVSTRRKMRK